ncbi:membrane protein [Streptococcus pneumoniae]|uniref:cell wall synthase accessory phosphoprotein MacP n=1 Tax=Streptococcus pneumoniae TaxID=1313 RepID=UPI000B58BE7A|nr:cell wall synthase accessory phosphoprotein MacP [Streptococcus pneumoniae]SNK30864.1 membrane protein [Streptococcus pneumoniae]VNE25583.1 membrane protein [Streptococcus pneumoniae]
MGKSLLTDEMIERANRGEKISDPPLLDDNEETKILPTSSSRFGYANPKDHGFSQETLKIQVEPSIHKSRRIENTKRNVFNSKLNKILFAVIFLLILLVLAMKLL